MYGIKCDICGKKLTSDITYYSLGDCRHCTCRTCIKEYQKLNNMSFWESLSKLCDKYGKGDGSNESEDSC